METQPMFYSVDSSGFVVASSCTSALLPDNMLLVTAQQPLKRDKSPAFSVPKWDREAQKWVDGSSAMLQAVRSTAAKSIDEQASAYITNLRSPDPIRNLEYDQKAAEARAIAAMPSAPSPMIDAEAEAVGMDRLLLAQNIRTRDDNFRRHLVRVNGLRRAAKLALETADMESVHTIAQQFRTNLAG